MTVQALIDAARLRHLRIATAESCTGGLVAGALTAIAGSSEVFERGFVTYSNEAKIELLGVDPELIAEHGAVSSEVAVAMAMGALENSLADIAVAITGVAGPGGGTPDKPVGLVHMACAGVDREDVDPETGLDFGWCSQYEFRFGDVGRDAVRDYSVRQALRLLLDPILMQGSEPDPTDEPE